MARQVAQIASKYTDQSLVVINKPGGSGLLALANVYNSKADGYTLLAFPAAFLAPIQTTDIGFSLDDFTRGFCSNISSVIDCRRLHRPQIHSLAIPTKIERLVSSLSLRFTRTDTHSSVCSRVIR